MKNKYQFIFSVFLLSVLQSSIAAGQDHKDSIILSLKPKECVVFKEGDKVEVKLMGTDPKTGKFKFSRKVLLPKPASDK